MEWEVGCNADSKITTTGFHLFLLVPSVRFFLHGALINVWWIELGVGLEWRWEIVDEEGTLNSVIWPR